MCIVSIPLRYQGFKTQLNSFILLPSRMNGSINTDLLFFKFGRAFATDADLEQFQGGDPMYPLERHASRK